MEEISAQSSLRRKEILENRTILEEAIAVFEREDKRGEEERSQQVWDEIMFYVREVLHLEAKKKGETLEFVKSFSEAHRKVVEENFLPRIAYSLNDAYKLLVENHKDMEILNRENLKDAIDLTKSREQDIRDLVEKQEAYEDENEALKYEVRELERTNANDLQKLEEFEATAEQIQSSWEVETEELSEQIVQLKLELQSAQEKKISLEAEMRNLREENEELRDNVAENEDSELKWEEILVDVKKSNEEKKALNEKMIEFVQTMKLERETFDREKKKLIEENKSLTERIEELENNIAEGIEAVQEVQGKNKEAILNFKKEREEDIRKLKKENCELKKQIGKSEKEIENVREKWRKTKRLKESLEQERRNLIETVANLEKQANMHNVSAQIDEINLENEVIIKELKKEIKQLKKRLIKKRKNGSECCKRSCEELKAMKESVKHIQEEWEKEKNSLIVRSMGLEQQLSLQGSKTDPQRLRFLEKRMAEVEKENASLRTEIFEQENRPFYEKGDAMRKLKQEKRRRERDNQRVKHLERKMNDFAKLSKAKERSAEAAIKSELMNMRLQFTKKRGFQRKVNSGNRKTPKLILTNN